MGNQLVGEHGLLKNPFSQSSTSAETVQVLSQFNFKTRYEDKYFGSVSLLQHKSTHQLIILKQVTFDSIEAMQANYIQFQKRREKLTCQNLIRLRYIIKKSENGFLSDEHKVIMFFDYILIDLQTEMENRKKQKKQFSSEQIGNILASTVKGYSFLEKEGIPNKVVRLSNIYFGVDNNPIVKVSDPNIFPSLSNIQSVIKRQSKYQQIFLAPQQMKMLEKRQIQHSLKGSVFTLGVCLLELCLMQPSQTLYNYKEKSINLREIDERLNMVKNKYTLGIYYVLKEMLEKNQQYRLTFNQLQQKIPTNIKNISKEHLSLTVAQKTQPKNNVIPLIPKQKNNNSSNFQNNINSPSLSNTKITPSIVPIQARQTTTLTSQYRPQISTHLQQVNQVYTNGNSYKGQKNTQNQRHGKGKYIYADGSYYYGDWIKNKMSGNGVLYYSDGQVQYDGQWKEDLFDGRGTLYGRGCDWNKYEGQFQNGQMSGFGTMNFNDGNTFTGSFRNDRPVGKGRLTSREGYSSNGFWQGGNFIKE